MTDISKFIHFQKIRYESQPHCDMIVYANADDHFYFFGNALFYCLGYERPHKELERQIPEKDWIKESRGHGIYLHETIAYQAVQRRATQENGFQNFQRWFNDYLANCRGKTPLKICPQPTTLRLF